MLLKITADEGLFHKKGITLSPLWSVKANIRSSYKFILLYIVNTILQITESTIWLLKKNLEIYK